MKPDQRGGGGAHSSSRLWSGGSKSSLGPAPDRLREHRLTQDLHLTRASLRFQKQNLAWRPRLQSHCCLFFFFLALVEGHREGKADEEPTPAPAPWMLLSGPAPFH